MTDKFPCETFDRWAEHADGRIQAAGMRLKSTWCKEAAAIPALIPLTSFVARAMNEHWPDPATAGAMLHELSQLAALIGTLQAGGGAKL